MNKPRFLYLPLLLLLIVTAGGRVRAGDATDQIRQTTDELIALARDPELKGPRVEAERHRRMKAAVDHRFDWLAISRSAMGRHWRTLSEAQREEFQSVFSGLIEQTYRSLVERYAGETLRYKSEKVDDRYGVVEVAVVTLDGKNIPMTYRVLKEGAEWMIYDVSIEGVSLVNNYRSQIVAILNRSSFEDLIGRLKAKTTAVREAPASGGAAGGDPAGIAIGKDEL